LGATGTADTLQVGERAFFLLGMPKNERANVSDKALQALKQLVAELLGYDGQAPEVGELYEVTSDE